VQLGAQRVVVDRDILLDQRRRRGEDEPIPGVVERLGYQQVVDDLVDGPRVFQNRAEDGLLDLPVVRRRLEVPSPPELLTLPEIPPVACAREARAALAVAAPAREPVTISSVPVVVMDVPAPCTCRRLIALRCE